MNSRALYLPATGLEKEMSVPTAVVRKVLRVPLPAKLIGANVVTIAAAVIAALYARSVGAGADSFAGILAAALVIGTAANVALTYTALRPIRDIEGTIKRMWRGETESRVASSAVGDPELDRIGYTVNSLLDQLERDREAMRSLASEVVRAEDRQQRCIGVQLHESTAQSLASITYMLTALAANSQDKETADRIMEIRRYVGDVLDEVDALSHQIHPRVLNDLGLAAGLRSLAFDVSRPGVPVSVLMSGSDDGALKGLGPETSSALYRIAQQAIQNALRHSGGDWVKVTIDADGQNLVLAIRDNGRGFSVEEALRRRPDKGLSMMRQRAELINARLRIESEPGKGSCVKVTMPMGVASIPR
jgi:signal transduction histidine kinase